MKKNVEVSSAQGIYDFQMWEACVRGDLLLWLAARIGVDRKLIVKVACLCAREALIHITVGDPRPRLLLETVERWTRGEATVEDVRATASALAYPENTKPAFHATYAVVNAARTIYSVPAYYAANAVVRAARANPSETAQATSLARSAGHVRSVIPWPAIETAIGNLSESFLYM